MPIVYLFGLAQSLIKSHIGFDRRQAWKAVSVSNAALLALRAVFQIFTAIIVKVDVVQPFAALMASHWPPIFQTSQFASWTRKVDVVLRMCCKLLYVCASVCIKERICLYQMALRTEVMQCGVTPVGKPRANTASLAFGGFL